MTKLIAPLFSLFLLLFLFNLSFGQEVPEKFSTIWDAVNSGENQKTVESKLEELRIKHSKDPWIYWISGIACNPITEVDKASIFFKKAIEVDSTFPHAYFNLAQISPDSTVELQNDLLRLYSKAIQFDPTLGFAFLGRGDVYFQLQQYDLALKDAENAIKTPEFDRIQAERLRVEIFWKLNKKEEAFKIVRKNDFNLEMWGTEFELVLASVFTEMGDLKQACDCYFRVSSMYDLFGEEPPLEIKEGLKKCK